MNIKFVIAVTNEDWFEILRQQPDLGEVNFWALSTRNFKALKPGELFLFKLPDPRNMIVGGGIFAHTGKFPYSLAWEAFGEANGARSAKEMRTRTARKRQVDPGDQSDFEINCRILTQPFFFAETDWIPAPQSWSRYTQTYKTYHTGNAEGMALWEAVNARRNQPDVPGMTESSARFGKPQLVPPRLGQGAFRMLVTNIYNRRCAITGERTLPALDAAHIRPYSDGGTHEAQNGLLLWRDIHRLFDAGYVTVTPDLHFEVSQSIREEFGNGRQYYALHGQKIQVPKGASQQPDPEALRWHNEQSYRG